MPYMQARDWLERHVNVVFDVIDGEEVYSYGDIIKEEGPGRTLPRYMSRRYQLEVHLVLLLT